MSQEYITDDEDRQITEIAERYAKMDINISQIMEKLGKEDLPEKIKLGVMFLIGLQTFTQEKLSNIEVHVIQPNIASTPN